MSVTVILGKNGEAKLHAFHALGATYAYTTLVYADRWASKSQLESAVDEHKVRSVLLNQTVTFDAVAKIEKVYNWAYMRFQYAVIAMMNQEWTQRWTELQNKFRAYPWGGAIVLRPGHSTLGRFFDKKDAMAHKEAYDSACKNTPYQLKISHIFCKGILYGRRVGAPKHYNRPRQDGASANTQVPQTRTAHRQDTPKAYVVFCLAVGLLGFIYATARTYLTGHKRYSDSP